jgi:predicted RNA binding protein YcfA (HicA-like mRNA interferase family)
MRIPRDPSGSELVKHLGRLGYPVTRKTGSHIRLTTRVRGEHHVTIPSHESLRTGALAAILDAVAAHHRLTREELLHRLLD